MRLQIIFKWSLTISLFLLLFSCSVQPEPTKTALITQSPQEEHPQKKLFSADPAEIQAGECSFLRWEVADVFFVSFENQPVDNSGERKVCPDKTSTYKLTYEDGKQAFELAVKIIVITPKATKTEPAATSLPTQPSELPQIQPGTPAFEYSQWEATGGPPGGLGYDIRMDPRNPDIMYVTDAQTGVFKSQDGGKTWFPINQGITSRTGYSGTAIPVFSLSLDPNNPDTIWVGTQFSSGVFRSDDAGQTWQAMNTGNNGIIEKQISIRGLTVEPGNSDVVYFAGEVSSWEWSGQPQIGVAMDLTKGVVYKSINGGRNWSRIWFGDNLARYIWINPDDVNILFVSTGIFDREAANSSPQLNQPGGVGILRSKDGGATWEILNENNGFHPNELYFGSLYMHPKNPNILLAAAGNDPYLFLGNDGGIYLTEDAGDHWKKVLNLRNASVVEICESEPNIVYAGSITGVHRSMDGGLTWKQMAGRLWGSEDMVAGFPIDMQCDPRNPMRIFVNNYIGGNLLSEDGGENWQVMSHGYTGAMQRQVGIAYTNSDLVYTAGRMGVFRSDDGGLNWLGTAHGPGRVPEAVVIAVNPFNSEHILAIFQDSGPDPLLSLDGGDSWQNIQTGLWQPGTFALDEMLTKIVFSKSIPNFVLASVGSFDCLTMRFACEAKPGLGIIRSLDGGQTWRKTNLSVGQVTDITIINEAAIYASVFPASIYRSTDRGESWEQISDNISATIPGTFIDIQGKQPYILSIDVDINNNRIYAGFERGGVMISDDGGYSWRHYSAGMPPETTIMDIKVDKAHPGIVYLASLNSGVYYKKADDEHWTAFNEGLIIRTAVDLSLSADGSVLYLATDGGGIYRLGPRE